MIELKDAIHSLEKLAANLAETDRWIYKAGAVGILLIAGITALELWLL